MNGVVEAPSPAPTAPSPAPSSASAAAAAAADGKSPAGGKSGKSPGGKSSGGEFQLSSEVEGYLTGVREAKAGRSRLTQG